MAVAVVPVNDATKQEAELTSKTHDLQKAMAKEKAQETGDKIALETAHEQIKKDRDAKEAAYEELRKTSSATTKAHETEIAQLRADRAAAGSGGSSSWPLPDGWRFLGNGGQGSCWLAPDGVLKQAEQTTGKFWDLPFQHSV